MDLFINVIAFVAQCAITYVAWKATAVPLKKRDEKRKRNYERTIWIAFLVGLASIVVGGVRGGDIRDELARIKENTEQIHHTHVAFGGAAELPDNPYFPMHVGQVPTLQFGYGNRGSYAILGGSAARLAFMLIGNDEYNRIKDGTELLSKVGSSSKETRCGTLQPNDPRMCVWDYSLPTRFDAQEIDDLGTGKLHLCVAGSVI